jgi:hypothetical protein
VFVNNVTQTLQLNESQRDGPGGARSSASGSHWVCPTTVTFDCVIMQCRWHIYYNYCHV